MTEDKAWKINKETGKMRVTKWHLMQQANQLIHGALWYQAGQDATNLDKLDAEIAEFMKHMPDSCSRHSQINDKEKIELLDLLDSARNVWKVIKTRAAVYKENAALKQELIEQYEGDIKRMHGFGCDSVKERLAELKGGLTGHEKLKSDLCETAARSEINEAGLKPVSGACEAQISTQTHKTVNMSSEDWLVVTDFLRFAKTKLATNIDLGKSIKEQVSIVLGIEEVIDGYIDNISKQAGL